MPAAERERVLDRFVRLEASRSEPGSGLGIESCRGRGAAAWWQPETGGQRARAQGHPRFADREARRLSTGRRLRGPREQRSGRRDGVLRAHHRVPARLRRGAGRRRARKPDQGVSRRFRARPCRQAARRGAEGPRAARGHLSPPRPISRRWRCAIPPISPHACCGDPDVHLGEARAGLAAAVAQASDRRRRSWRCCGGSSAAWRC